MVDMRTRQEPIPARQPKRPTLDLARATRAEILDRLAELHTERGDIKRTLHEAGVRYHTEGVRADPVWFSRAKAAVDVKAGQIAQLQAALPEATKRERGDDATERASRDVLFFAAYKRFVRELAGEDVHRRCCELASAEVDAAEGAAAQ